LGTNTKINFVQITVSEHNFKLNKKFKLSKNGIPVDIRFDVKTSFSRDKKTITSILSAILFSKTKNPPLDFYFLPFDSFNISDILKGGNRSGGMLAFIVMFPTISRRKGIKCAGA